MVMETQSENENLKISPKLQVQNYTYSNMTHFISVEKIVSAKVCSMASKNLLLDYD